MSIWMQDPYPSRAHAHESLIHCKKTSYVEEPRSDRAAVGQARDRMSLPKGSRRLGIADSRVRGRAAGAGFSWREPGFEPVARPLPVTD
jgi:hypothetical protein